ncbi:YciI family protein [Burkholderia sp. Ap-962]|uniref:YciI family protein n=2 Tax=Burkholderia TaxID=32008 RepID=UPI0031F5C237
MLGYSENSACRIEKTSEVIMIYCVLFEDDEAFAHARAANMEAHLAFLAAQGGRIREAGPLVDTSTRLAAGGLWTVEAESAERVLDYIRQDPFWPTGLRKAWRILEWKQVFSTLASEQASR